MKRWILALLLLPVMANAQKGELPIVNGEVVYEKVITVDDATKDQIYQYADSWYKTYAENYSSYKKVDNPHTGQLIIQSGFESKYKGALGGDKAMEIEYMATFLIKDGKTKITLNGIKVIDPSIRDGNYTTLKPEVDLIKTTEQAKKGKKEAVKIIEMVNREMSNLIAGIEKALTANNF